MSRYKITAEYEGTRYRGWQMQKGERTIQGELSRACEEVFRTDEFDIQASGRTDAGVHALGQVFLLDVPDNKLTLQAVGRRLNEELPHDINILKAEKASAKFHARHDAVARSYIYQISTRRAAFGKHLSWWLRDAVNVAKMKDAAAQCTGLRDFSSFTDDTGDHTSTKVDLIRLDIHERPGGLLIHFVASHFLWKMVRRLTGTLVAIGDGRVDPRRLDTFLREKSPEPAAFTAPPSGLFLHKVYYEGDGTDYSLRDFNLTAFPNATAE